MAGAIQKGTEDEGVLVAGVCCGVLEPRDRTPRQEAGLIDAGIGSAGSDPKLSPDCNMTGSFTQSCHSDTAPETRKNMDWLAGYEEKLMEQEVARPGQAATEQGLRELG